jgi:hypothetical protein
MLSFLIMNAAVAATVQGGVQVAAFPSALDFAENRLKGEVFSVYREEATGEDVACFDEVGIRDLNVEVPIDNAEFHFDEDTIVINIHFGLVHGEDMVLFGIDDDTFDACPSFETDFYSFSLESGRLLVELAPSMVEGRLDLEVRGNPSFTGDISTDIENVPDTLILAFIEDRIFETVEGLILEKVPELTTALVGSSLYVDKIGSLGLDVQLTDLAVDNTLMVGMDVDATWLGDGCPISGVADGPTGRDPSVDFEGGNDSNLGVAVTEYQINRLFHGAWEDGLFCFEAGPLNEVIEVVEGALSGTAENSEVELDFKYSPHFEIEENRITLTIEGLHLAVYGELDGESRALIGLDADIVLEAEIRIDPEISSFVFSLVNAELELDTLIADPLVQDPDGLSERLAIFLEGWAMDSLAARMDNVPLYGNMFQASDIFLRIDEIRAQAGAVSVLGSLYNADDPEVDTEAPDTSARIASATNTQLTVQWTGEDNKEGPLAYSWRIDYESWSPWTSDSGESMSTPNEGSHVLEVRARDAWLNVDPTPSMIVFRVDPPFEKAKGCGCASTPTPRQTIPWVFMCMVLGVSRRRE